MDQPTPFAHSQPPAVLIVSDDPTFVGRIVVHWGENEDCPALQVVRSENCAGCRIDDFQLVVLGGMRPNVCEQVLAAFRPWNTPLIVVGITDESLQAAEWNSSKVIVLPSLPNWLELLMAMGAEIRRRTEAQARARQIKRVSAEIQCEAALGRYMIDLRHNLNNALTSVLGNAELLLLDEAKLATTERKQIDTIRVMALRMNETLQRFSSLEHELRATASQRIDAETFRLSVEQDRMVSQDQKVITTKDDRRPQLARAAGAD